MSEPASVAKAKCELAAQLTEGFKKPTVIPNFDPESHECATNIKMPDLQPFHHAAHGPPPLSGEVGMTRQVYRFWY